MQQTWSIQANIIITILRNLFLEELLCSFFHPTSSLDWLQSPTLQYVQFNSCSKKYLKKRKDTNTSFSRDAKTQDEGAPQVGSCHSVFTESLSPPGSPVLGFYIFLWGWKQTVIRQHEKNYKKKKKKKSILSKSPLNKPLEHFVQLTLYTPKIWTSLAPSVELPLTRKSVTNKTDQF